MGKIIVVEPDGKKADQAITNCIFKILRVALAPNGDESSSVRGLLTDIVKYHQLSKKWKGRLNYRRGVKVTSIRSFYIHLHYNPEEDPFANCFIYSFSQDPETGHTATDKVFMGLFAVKDPETTELTIETLVEPVTLWLPELKTF
ncbi:hypothetical protein IKT64_02030 [Candidatus Saccharibacteria bacterium]|nr:hypothetical protein [Candidatus Saccharibacteria bacterium]